jgi:DNA-binding XRE family transcriptional regulator
MKTIQHPTPMTGSHKMEEKKRSSDAVEWSYNRYIKGRPEMEAYFEELGVQSDLAQQIYDIRNRLRMSREDLAELSGLTAETIEDLEETDYEGNWDEAIERINRAFERWIKEVIIPAAQMKPEEYSVRAANA